MNDFARSRHDINEGADQFMELFHGSAQAFMKMFDEKANAFVASMADAEAKHEEQAVTIATQNETIAMLKQEIERVTADYEARIDALHQENAALRSTLGEKDKKFGALARTNRAMMTSAQAIVMAGAHGFNLIGADRMAGKIFTSVRPAGKPTTTTMSEFLAGAGERLPTEREQAAG